MRTKKATSGPDGPEAREAAMRAAWAKARAWALEDPDSLAAWWWRNVGGSGDPLPEFLGDLGDGLQGEAREAARWFLWHWIQKRRERIPIPPRDDVDVA